MARLALPVAVTLLAAGCATTKPFDHGRARELSGQTFVVATHAKPQTFMAQTAGKATFGVVGVFAMANAGSALVAEHKLEDPAPVVRDAFASALADQLGMQRVTPDVDGDAPVLLAKIDKRASYALEVRSTGWGFIYFPTNWTHYWIQYGVTAKLFDTRTKAVLAEAGCLTPKPETTDGAPTYDEMMADGAARLRYELTAAAAYCAEDLRKQMFLTSLKPMEIALPPRPEPTVVPAAAPAPEAPPSGASTDGTTTYQ